MAERMATSFKLDQETLNLLDALAARYGVTRAAALRFIVRDAAQRAGMQLAPLMPAELMERPGPKARRAAK